MKKELFITLEMSYNHDGWIFLSPELRDDLRVHKTKCVGMTSHLEDAEPTFVHIFWNQAKETFAFVKVKEKDFNLYPCAVAHYLRDREQVTLISYSPNVPQICYRLGKMLDEGEQLRIRIKKERDIVNGKKQTVYLFDGVID